VLLSGLSRGRSGRVDLSVERARVEPHSSAVHTKCQVTIAIRDRRKRHLSETGARALGLRL